jgi:hypothetical protein
MHALWKSFERMNLQLNFIRCYQLTADNAHCSAAWLSYFYSHTNFPPMLSLQQQQEFQTVSM